MMLKSFQGRAHAGARADEPFNSDIGTFFCQSRREAGLRCGLYASPPFSAVRRQGSGTRACSGIQP